MLQAQPRRPADIPLLKAPEDALQDILSEKTGELPELTIAQIQAYIQEASVYELKKFFEDMTEYGSIAVFSLVKYVDIKSFSISWRLRYKDISTKEEVRDKKINTIL